MENPVWMLRRVGVNSNPILLKAGLNKVGRSNEKNNIVCQSIWVSRYHCDINMKDGTVFIKDHGSFNGTYINTSRIESGRFIELKKGEHISLGKPYTKGEVICKDHYVYEVCSSGSYQMKGPVKRRSASPYHDPAKRCRGMSPQKKIQTPGNVELIDLTSEEPCQIKVENVFSCQDKVAAQRYQISTNSCLPARPLVITNSGGNGTFLPEFQPLANSTLMNGNNTDTANIDDPNTIFEKLLVKINGNNYNNNLKNDNFEKLKVAFFDLLKDVSEDKQNSSNFITKKQLTSPNTMCPTKSINVSSAEVQNNILANCEINKGTDLSKNQSSSGVIDVESTSQVSGNSKSHEEERTGYKCESNEATVQKSDNSNLNLIRSECQPKFHGGVVSCTKGIFVSPLESSRSVPTSEINNKSMSSSEQLVKEDNSSLKYIASTFVNKKDNEVPLGGLNSVVNSPKSERIIYKEGGVIRKGAKRKIDNMNIINNGNYLNKSIMANPGITGLSNTLHVSNKPELKTRHSMDSSGEEFLGFNDKDFEATKKSSTNSFIKEGMINILSGCSSLDDSHVTSSKDEVIRTSLNSTPKTCNKDVEPLTNSYGVSIGTSRQESPPSQINSSKDKEVAQKPNPDNCELSSISPNSKIIVPTTVEPNLRESIVDDSIGKGCPQLIPRSTLSSKNSSVTLNNLTPPEPSPDTFREKSIYVAKRTKRRNSSFDAKDVEKLLNDLEKSTDATDSPVQAVIIIPHDSVKECNATSNHTTNFKGNNKNTYDEYKTLEKELRSVVGEPSDDSLQFTEFKKPSKHNLEIITPSENQLESEKTDVDEYDQNNSFSQGGMDSIIEIDEDDVVYSQIFNEKENNLEENELEPNPMLICSRIIKMEVDEVLEDAGLELFESHFSQCSQEVDEHLLADENRQSTVFEDIPDEDKILGEKSSLERGIEKRELIKEDNGHDVDTLRKEISISKEQMNSPKDLEPEHSGGSCDKVVNCKELDGKKTKLPKTFKKSSIIIPHSLEKNNEMNNLSSETTTTTEGKKEKLSGAKLVKSTLLSKPPERAKRGRKSKEETSATKEAQLKQKKQELISERKAKLKNLALNKGSGSACGISHGNLKIVSNKENETDLQTMDSSDKQNDHKTDSTENNIKKVAKITERNRSTILLEGFLESKPETRRRGRSKSKQIIPDSLELIEKKESCKKDELHYKIQKGCLKSPNMTLTQKKSVKFNLQPSVRSFECEGILNPIKNNKDRALVPVSTIHSREISSDGFIINVLHWNTSWIKESKKVKGDPPVYHEVFNTKDLFVSYNDYKRWIYPLLLYELWANMMKQVDDMESLKSTRTFEGLILMKEPRRSSNNTLLTLKCCVPLQGKDIPKLIDPMDILLLYVFNAAKKCLVMYGIVMSQVKVCSVKDNTDPFVRTYLAKLKFKPDVCAYFDLVIYNSLTKPVETGFYFRLQHLYNMGNEIRQYESLVKLEASPLLWTILDPEEKGIVFLSKDINEKIISTNVLNEEQKRAILCTSQTVFTNKPSISLILGPPGTGKTRVIVALVEQILYRFKSKNGRRQRILLCAQTNTAVDEICLRLLEIRRLLPREKRFKLIRYGRKERINPKLTDILSTSIARNEVEKMNLDEVFSLELSLLRAQERMISYSLDNSPKAERYNYRRKYESVQAQINILQAVVEKTGSEELRRKEIDRLVGDEELKVIFHADIVATTLGSCTSRRLLKAFNTDSGVKESKGEIGVCIIDEATQATDLTTLLPLLHDVKNFILVGDPQQLPPVVNSETCKKNGLSRSLFSRLHKVWSEIDPNKLSPGSVVPVYKLTSQYRMHPEIAKFPSLKFYNNELITPPHLSVSRGYQPYALFTHKFLSDSANVETNQKEAELLVNVVDAILLEPLFKSLSIGLIVPYQKQRALVTDLVYDKKWMRQVAVSTIDSYQGQEKDVIILTCVRTNGVGFLSDYQRMNVALTRAKRALYVIGNFSSLMGDPFWKSLFDNAQARGVHCNLKSSSSPKDFMDFVIVDKKRRSR